MSPPLRALADSRAGVCLRHGADGKSDERKQGACDHLHAGEPFAVTVGSKNIPRLTPVSPPDSPLDVHNNKYVYQSKQKLPGIDCGVWFWCIGYNPLVETVELHWSVMFSFLYRAPGVSVRL